MSDTINGRFVWHELMSNDPEAALKFYRPLAGWETRETDLGPDGKYHILQAGGKQIGGLLSADKSRGVPGTWLGYVAVEDVNGLVERATQLGGKCVVKPGDIPETGRYAIVSDPSGAFIALFKGLNPISPDTVGLSIPGGFCWNELLTSDTEGCTGFYEKLFGWTTQTQQMGEMGLYHLFKQGDQDVAGMMQMPPSAHGPSRWLLYIAVQDVDAAADQIQQLGGNIFCRPTSIPNIGRFAVAADPQGAVVAVFKSSS